MALSVKAKYLSNEAPEGETRRFSVPQDLTDDVYEFISRKTTELFGIESPNNISLHWEGKSLFH